MKKSDSKPKSRKASDRHVKRTGQNPVAVDRLEQFLAKHMELIFRISLAVTFIVGILLFDIRFSMTGDDSAYVIRAYDFIHQNVFPGFQGPLYPIALSPVVAMFGLAAIPLKGFSLLCILGFSWFTYRSFRNRIPPLLLASLLILIPVNSCILYYGSQTYSEAFFMFIQALTMYLFFTFFMDDREMKTGQTRVKRHLVFACCLFCLGLARPIGFTAVPAVAAFFLLKRQWKDLALAVTFFATVFLFYEAVTFLISSPAAMQGSEALKGLMSRNYYKPALGHETATGFLQRFMVNSDFYISKSFYSILGLRSTEPSGEVYPLLTLATAAVIILSVILSYRRNSYLLFTGIYSVITLSVIFFIAHTMWMQDRFIIPYASLVILLLLAAFYYLFSLKGKADYRILVTVLVAGLFASSLKVTADKVKDTRKITDPFYGLTPDWDNYCRMSKWTADNLPENTTVACRKASISFIYGNGRKFYGITRVPFSSANSLLADWKKKQRPYLMIPTAALNNKPVSEQMARQFFRGIVGYGINVKNDFYDVQFFIMDFPEDSKPGMISSLSALGIPVTGNPDSLEARLKAPDADISVVYPDSILKILWDARVTHVLTDNIRMFPDRKNQQTITTTERLMNFLDAKYPGIRRKVMQVGDNDNEPASLYAINYDLAGLPGR